MDPFMMLLPPVRDLSSTILFCCRIGWDGVNSCQDLEQILPFSMRSDFLSHPHTHNFPLSSFHFASYLLESFHVPPQPSVLVIYTYHTHRPFRKGKHSSKAKAPPPPPPCYTKHPHLPAFSFLSQDCCCSCS
jgi:hypothetical protein